MRALHIGLMFRRDCVLTCTFSGDMPTYACILEFRPSGFVFKTALFGMTDYYSVETVCFSFSLCFHAVSAPHAHCRRVYQHAVMLFLCLCLNAVQFKHYVTLVDRILHSVLFLAVTKTAACE